MAAESFLGVVVRSTGSWYEVMNGQQRVQCRIRGKLRLKGVRSTNPVVVGDVFLLSLADESSNKIAPPYAP